MHSYEALQQLAHDRLEQRQEQGRAERLARDARAGRPARRRRLAGGLAYLSLARRRPARARAGA